MRCPHCKEPLLKPKPWQDPRRDAIYVAFCVLAMFLLGAGLGGNVYIIGFLMMLGFVGGTMVAAGVDMSAKDRLEREQSESSAQRAAQNRRDVDAWYEASKAGKPDKTHYL
jgi:hypothetical protein